MAKKKKDELQFINIEEKTNGNVYLCNTTQDIEIDGITYHLQTGKKIELPESEQVKELLEKGILTRYQNLDRRIK